MKKHAFIIPREITIINWPEFLPSLFCVYVGWGGEGRKTLIKGRGSYYNNCFYLNKFSFYVSK